MSFDESIDDVIKELNENLKYNQYQSRKNKIGCSKNYSRKSRRFG